MKSTRSNLSRIQSIVSASQLADGKSPGGKQTKGIRDVTKYFKCKTNIQRTEQRKRLILTEEVNPKEISDFY